jgi:hypothetical protein
MNSNLVEGKSKVDDQSSRSTGIVGPDASQNNKRKRPFWSLSLSLSTTTTMPVLGR